MNNKQQASILRRSNDGVSRFVFRTCIYDFYEWIEKDRCSFLKGNAVFYPIYVGLLRIPDKTDTAQVESFVHRLKRKPTY